MNSTGGPFSNVVRNLRQIRTCYGCWTVVGIITGIHLAVTFAGGPLNLRVWQIYELFGLTRDGILEGKVWKLVTYGLLHGSWWHVLMNVAFVLLVGSRVEYMVGRTLMLQSLVLGIIGGGLAHVLLSASGRSAPLLVGLSGGCIALLLLLTTLSPQSRMMPLPVSGRSLGIGILASEFLLSLINPAVGVPFFSEIGRAMVGYGLSSWFEMGHACHFGGGLAGWACGRWILRPRVTLKRLHAERKRREAEDD